MEGKNVNRVGIFLLVLFLLFTNFVCLYLLYQLHCQFEQQALSIEQQSLLIENLQTRVDLLTFSLEETDKHLLHVQNIKRMDNNAISFYKWTFVALSVYFFCGGS